MRVPALLVLLSLFLAIPADAGHDEGKGARSLGGRTVERLEAILVAEADAFPDKPVGQLETDARATGGQAWNLTTYGMITTTIDVPTTGVAWFDIRARGWHPDDMRNPHMHILIDGVQRAEWDVRGDWLTYPQSIPILAGKHTIAIDDFNNYRADVADRTIVVDWLSMSAPTLEGSPIVPAGGYVVVDAPDIHNSVTGQPERSTSARNNTLWLQWGVGCFAEMIVFEGAGDHVLSARLRGDEWDGVGSRVQVSVDGAQVEQYFVGATWETRDTRFQVQKGPHVLEICYDNDEPGKKRNLRLDELSVTSSAAAVGMGNGSNVSAPAWSSAHAGLDNHRHVVSAIDAASIRTARQAWTFASGTVTGTPAVDEGIVYFGDYNGKVRALRATDGSVVWTADIGAGVDSSVALDATRVLVGDQKGWVTALARSDGALLWRTQADEVNGTHLYGSPVVHDGVVYSGVASEQTLIEFTGDQTFRGSVIALRASDGVLLWKTYTQEPAGKGVSVWSTPAIDPALGLLFVGSGNSYGEPVSAYTDSILALRLADGSIAWSYQGTSGDAFDARGGAGPDRDFGSSPILFEAGGKALVGDGDKGGTYYALERATGALVWRSKVPYRVDGVAPSRLEGFLGSGSYHEGVLYAPTTSRSMVNAIDAADGSVLWSTELNPLPARYGDRMFAPSTAAEGIVLQGNAFGNVFALDMKTGEVLANLSAGGGVQGGIALAGSRFFVPHVGKDIWTGRGGVTAFIVDSAQTTPPTPALPPTVTSAVTPSPQTTTTPQATTPSEGGEGIAAIDGAISGPGVVLILVALGLFAALFRQPRRG